MRERLIFYTCNFAPFWNYCNVMHVIVSQIYFLTLFMNHKFHVAHILQFSYCNAKNN